MKYLLLVFLIPIIGFSQNTRKVFVESGVTSFIPFVKEERSYGNFENQYFRDLKYTYKTTPGYFIKCGIEILPKTERRFTVTVPLSIGYKEFNKDNLRKAIMIPQPQIGNIYAPITKSEPKNQLGDSQAHQSSLVEDSLTGNH